MTTTTNQRVRVVVAGQTPPPIGGQNICIQQMIEILSKSDDFTVCHLPFEFTKSWDSARRFGLDKIIELIKVIFRLISIRLEDKIDVVIFPAGGPHLLPIARDIVLLPWVWLCSDRLAIHFHAAGLYEFVKSKSFFVRKLLKITYGFFSSEAIVLTSYGIKDAEVAGITKTHILYNSTEDHANGVTSREDRESYHIIHIGHLCPDKGTPQLLKAFSKIYQKRPNLNLKLVGDPLPPYSIEKLKSDIECTNCSEHISWPGPLHGSDLHNVFKEADLLVFSSIAPYESFGLVMIEAMQWSLPLVITDWRANREVCTKDFGGVVAECSDKDLEAALELALIDALDMRKHWNQWGTSNRLIYEENYSVEAYTAKLCEILNQK